jgi:glutaminase
MDFQAVLDEIVHTLRPLAGQQGVVASYIPALVRVDPAHFGMALRTCDGQEAQAGDSAQAFSIQSISKVF